MFSYGTRFRAGRPPRIRCVRSYRTLRDGSFGGRFPGTSCQATISLSLRDEKYILHAEALIKLALMSAYPGVLSSELINFSASGLGD